MQTSPLVAKTFTYNNWCVIKDETGLCKQNHNTVLGDTAQSVYTVYRSVFVRVFVPDHVGSVSLQSPDRSSEEEVVLY